ncbi:MAG: methyl-accepting chemotaxis protein [Thermodesulfobacteriota bacterium]
MKVSLGHKFIVGFILVVATVAFVPHLVGRLDMPEWLREPITFLCAIVIGLILGSILVRNITKHFQRLIRAASEISAGNLTSESYPMTEKRMFQDETVELEDALCQMHTNLRELVGHIKKSSLNLADTSTTMNRLVSEGQGAAEAVGRGTSKIFSGALDQANHIDSSSITIREVVSLADEIAEKVSDTAVASAKVNTMVKRGVQTATSAIGKMERRFKDIESTTGHITALEEKITTISRVMDVITHISRQTDILALNATIEASKAGEHGRGFAMVAEEVRRFADNTKRSVDDVTHIVKDVRGEMERVVLSVQEGGSFIKEGREDIQKVRDILAYITTYTSEVAEKANNITAFTKKQKGQVQGTVELFEQVSQIAKDDVAITEEVDESVGRNTKSMNSALATSQKLTQLSQELNSVVSRFKVEDEGGWISSPEESNATAVT